ncbi:MAG TPA: hypothetical protein VER35_01070 [Candidatus Limnocylindrales bacterium]|nr:hypothetical protein [Candidatus Limnocylindrales bacterium]
MRKNAHTVSVIKIAFFAIFVIAAIGSLNVTMSAINYENQSNVNYRIDEYLREIVNNQTSNENISVVIILKEQPAYDISSKIKKEYTKDILSYSDERAEILYTTEFSAAVIQEILDG